MSKGMCTECNLRSTCTKLCEKAEEFTRQDEVNQKVGIDGYNAIISNLIDNYSNEIDIWEFVQDSISEEDYNIFIEKYNFTEKQKEIIYLLYVDGLRQYEVAGKLGISQPAIIKHLNFIKNKINKIG